MRFHLSLSPSPSLSPCFLPSQVDPSLAVTELPDYEVAFDVKKNVEVRENNVAVRCYPLVCS